MADVLYIHPAKFGVDAPYQGVGTPYPQMPVGVIALANLLQEQGLTVRGINYPLELVLNRRFKLKPWIRGQPNVRLVMVDLHWYEHSYGAISVARACQQALPRAHVVLGGITASLYAQEILNSFPEVDFIICGDAEEPLRALASELFQRRQPELFRVPNLCYRFNGQVVENGLSYCATPANLDALDFVDIDFLEHADLYQRFQFITTGRTPDDTNRRGHWLCVGRGCRFDCSFCGGGQESHKVFAARRNIVLRSVDKVADDMQRLEEQGVGQVSLNLDPAILGPEYWKPLFAQLRRRGVCIGIYNEHFQLPSQEFIEDFVRTADIPRSELALSPLSGSEKVRHLNGKSYSNRSLYRLLYSLKEAEIPLYVFFSLNLPGEDNETFGDTLNVARRIARYYPPHLLKMENSVHTLDPCSAMSREPSSFGIDIQMQSFMDYYDYCQATQAAQPGTPLESHRGFTLSGGQTRSLEQMADQWDEFCATRDFHCFPVRRVW